MPDRLCGAARFVISPARPQDRADWLLLWRHYQLTLPPAVDERTWTRIVDPREPIGCLIAWRQAGSAVGFASYVLHPTTWSERLVCHLQDLFVLAPARRQGAGGQLLEALVAQGTRDGWGRIDVVTASDNEAASRLYRRIGRLKDGLRYEIPIPNERRKTRGHS